MLLEWVWQKSKDYRCPFIANQSSAERMAQEIRSLVFYHQHQGMRLINLLQVIIILGDLGARLQNMKMILKTYHKLWLALIRGDEKVIQEFIIHFNLERQKCLFLAPSALIMNANLQLRAVWGNSLFILILDFSVAMKICADGFIKNHLITTILFVRHAKTLSLAKSGNLLMSCLTGVSLTPDEVILTLLTASFHLSEPRIARITSLLPRAIASSSGLWSLRLMEVRSAPLSTRVWTHW